MQRINIQPEEIMVQGNYQVRDQETLGKHFQDFSKGQTKTVPPVVVARLEDIAPYQTWLEEGNNDTGIERFSRKRPKAAQARRQDYEAFFAAVQQAPYLLLDGSHRALAATLARRPISALELATEEDFEKMVRMIQTKKLPNPERPEKSLEDLKKAFILYCLDITQNARGHLFPASSKTSRLRYIKTLRQQADELVENNDVAKHMRDHYLKNS